MGVSAWREISLGEICEFKYGKSLPKKERIPGRYPVYGSNGKVGSHNQALTNGPTVIIGRKGSFGEVAYSDSACWPIDTTYFIDSTATQEDLKWLSYRIRNLGLTELNRAAAIPGLNREDAYRKRLLLPPLDEQRRIAAVLDKVDALRTKRREAIALLDDLTQSVFLDMFGDPVSNDRNWPPVSVGEFVSHFESGKNFAAAESEDPESQFRILKVSSVTSGNFLPKESKPVPAGYNPPESHIVRNGDLLFSRANTELLIGATALVENAPKNLLLPDKLWRFVWHSERKANPLYVRQLFRQSKFRREVSRRASGTSGSMKNISQQKVLSIPCGLPPLELQDQFAERVSAITSLKEAHRTHLAHLDELFASLQQRAFRGELFSSEAA